LLVGRIQLPQCPRNGNVEDPVLVEEFGDAKVPLQPRLGVDTKVEVGEALDLRFDSCRVGLCNSLLNFVIESVTCLGNSMAIAAELAQETHVGSVPPGSRVQAMSRLNKKDAHLFWERCFCDDTRKVGRPAIGNETGQQDS
jgi:hypothetical protein